MNHFNLLSKFPAFGLIPWHVFVKKCQNLTKKSCAPRKFLQPNSPDSILLILSGTVRVTVPSEQHKKPVVKDTLTTRSVYGLEQCLFPRTVMHPVSLRADKTRVDYLEIPNATMFDIMEDMKSNQNFQLDLMWILADRLYRTEHDLCVRKTSNLRGLVCHELGIETGNVLTVPQINRASLSRKIGASTRAVADTVSRLIEEGLLVETNPSPNRRPLNGKVLARAG